MTAAEEKIVKRLGRMQKTLRSTCRELSQSARFDGDATKFIDVFWASSVVAAVHSKVVRDVCGKEEGEE